MGTRTLREIKSLESFTTTARAHVLTYNSWSLLSIFHFHRAWLISLIPAQSNHFVLMDNYGQSVCCCLFITHHCLSSALYCLFCTVTWAPWKVAFRLKALPDQIRLLSHTIPALQWRLNSATSDMCYKYMPQMITATLGRVLYGERVEWEGETTTAI